MFDVLIKNGKTEREQPIEVGINGNCIAAIAPKLEGASGQKEIDLHGHSYVSAGWIDDHVHCYEKLTLYYDDPDADGYKSGVTTVIDAGSTGADNIRDFYNITRDKKTNVYALINIGRTGILAQDELGDMEKVNKEALFDVVVDLPDFIVGTKARESHSVVIDNDIKPLLAARSYAAVLGHLPIMVHVGGNPPELQDILQAMGAGDVLTHAYNGKPNGMIDENGEIKDFVYDAYDRGMVFDVGHGTDSFNFKTMKIARDHGLDPKSLSTDIYHRNRENGPVYDMVTTMEKMLQVGYTLPEVIRMVTFAPADTFHLLNKGRLRPGKDADITIYNVATGDKVLTDSNGNTETGHQLITPICTIVGGTVYDLEAQRA
ncbi:dihydroorotase [Lacticaseibacillus casei]|uniref:Amidohydrolase/deacetylase family metallohydrolase n=1 Tax=Lacticaseibacillus zeae TaxID=57037 RepID=A0A5R8LUN4_LACZE|nr:amidohydrolase/deacetylase family metallohydrolase [Lacticaseibacillus zeae]OLS10376.1 dihydroorotase [Lacticaseibacillus casei]QVI31895.1 amidohydrolase/deacetylase family metallohydrolase [Lacticaseibacillus zeae]TLF40918.1 amidohydrolase/deacetylase family metallohydrolase [Lacticaseibacillus zeae]